MTPSPKPLPLAGFSLAALMPLPLLLLGAGLGGVWLWAAFLYMAVLTILLDQLVPLTSGAAEGAEFPAAEILLVTVGVGALGVLPLATWAIAGPGPLGAWERVLLFLATGFWLGQVAHPAAHELIHRPRRELFRLGAAVYVSLLFGHHISAHRLVHHVHVATDADPNSARLGESFWRFFPRAWIGSFRAGLAAEQARAAHTGRTNPYLIWVGGGRACIVLVGLGFGPRAALDYLGLCLYAQMQLMLSDYVQHYGLRRRIENGRTEPVGPRHSWDAPHPLSSLTMVNAPRHSDHHAHPARHYPALRLTPENPRPMLPYSLPVMGAMAMVPQLWRRVMDKRVARMRAE